jgi:hypothetical protein
MGSNASKVRHVKTGGIQYLFAYKNKMIICEHNWSLRQ